MFPLLFSFLSGVRELSATASLEELLQPEASPQHSIVPGVSSRDLIASLCPVAAALVVATVRHYNEKRMQERTSDLHVYSSPLLTFGDVNAASYNNCGDLGAVLKRRRSETFYVSEDSIVVFRVIGVLYRVHKHYFCSEPSVFADMFVGSPPQSVEVDGEQQLEGTSDESAIEIPGVTPVEFEALLRFFYSSYEIHDTSPEYWIDLLSVATRLRFTRIRARAIRTIDTKFECLCAVEKLIAGVKFNVEEWIFSSFSNLCRREKPLNDAEARRLGIVTVTRIARAREVIYNPSASTSLPADRVVEEAFKGTLR